MSGYGKEPESPLVIGTWKRWKRQTFISSTVYYTSDMFLYGTIQKSSSLL